MRARGGFTLVELLVVVLIVGVLVAVSAPSFLGQTQKAHDSAASQYLDYGYQAALADAVTREGVYTDSSHSVGQLAAAIQAAEPELDVAVGSCPEGATLDPRHVVLGQGTGGKSLELCNDPHHTVFVLTTTFPAPPAIAVLTGVPLPPNPPAGPTTLNAASPNEPVDPEVPTLTTSVTGAGQLRLEGGFRNFSFEVQAYSDGSVQGVAQLDNRAQGAREHIALDCLVVDGDQAWAGGTVLTSTSPTQPVGSVGVFYLEDNGQGKDDRISLFSVFGGGLTCADAAAQATTQSEAQALQGGNLVIHRQPAVP